MYIAGDAFSLTTNTKVGMASPPFDYLYLGLRGLCLGAPTHFRSTRWLSRSHLSASCLHSAAHLVRLGVSWHSLQSGSVWVSNERKPKKTKKNH